MTRQIKFRGITTSKPHRWVYGYLLRFIDTDEIFDTENMEQVTVIPETVGQFTGLTDKDGKEIFEGDILIIDPERQITVAWNATYASWCLYSSNWVYTHWFGESCDPEDCTITCTIHDYMLEGGKNE